MRPNILFLMSDQHRPDCTGYEGDPIVRTPTLDHLARTGVVFRNAYTPSPICIPARQCMAAGQLPRTCGAERYGDDIPPFSMTFARRLAQFGYAAVACGKLHHDGPDQMQGWSSRYGGDMHVEPRHMTGRDAAAWKTFRHPSSYRSRDDAGEVLRAGVGRGRYTHDRDRYALDGAFQFIEHHYLDLYADKPSPDQPVLLMVSFNRPHSPFLTSEPLLQQYLNRVTPFVNEPAFDHPVLSAGQVVVGTHVSERDIRKATAAYYGMVEEIDSDYARVMRELERIGHNLDDWIIIYAADHGEMLGQHGVWSKGKFFEASVRVPLIIRWPRRFQPRVVNENVNLCDLFATICELAAVPLPDVGDTVHARGLDSRSLVPLIQGLAVPWRQRHGNETISQFAGRHLMIKRDALKYQHYGENGHEVLFDLDADPSERTNLIDRPSYGQALAAFRARRDALGFGADRSAYSNAGYDPRA